MENLSEMVKDEKTNPSAFSAEELDLPEEAAEAVEDTTEVAQETGPPSIGITGLSTWLEENIDKFANINIPRGAIRGVDPIKNMTITVSDGSGETDGEGHEKRDLFIFKNSASIPILDLPGLDMQIYNNGFRVTYDYDNGVFIKCYGVKLGLIVVFCNNINDKIIPYAITRVKKKDNEIECLTSESGTIVEKMSQPLDIEALHLRYKQSSKVEDLSTNADAIDWLLARQAEVTDINHHLQIDNVIIDTLE
jgi:hypothetical protein